MTISIVRLCRNYCYTILKNVLVRRTMILNISSLLIFMNSLFLMPMSLNVNSIRTNNYVVSFKTLWMDAKPVTKPISSILKLQQPILRRWKIALNTLTSTYKTINTCLIEQTVALHANLSNFIRYSAIHIFWSYRSKMTAIRSTVDSTLSCYTLLVLRNAKRIIKPWLYAKLWNGVTRLHY